MSATATGSLNLTIGSRESEFIEAVHEVVATGSQHTAANSSGPKCITNLKLARVDQVPANKSKRKNNLGRGEGGYEREVIHCNPYQGASGLSIDCRTLTLDIALPASEKEQTSICKVE